MKIAFLGKGGSGKSTMATAFVQQLHSRGYNVMAVDADYNMDLSYNLGADPTVYLGTDPDYIKEHLGLSRDDTYAAALQKGREAGVFFTAFPPDSYTNRVSIELTQGLRLITAGPHTDRIRSQEYCSHSLAAPLKVYLPLLALKTNEAVVIDERAGTDPVATGILTGVDLAVVVREPTIHSTRVANQIEKELELAGVRSVIVDNKRHGITEDTARACELIVSRI